MQKLPAECVPTGRPSGAVGAPAVAIHPTWICERRGPSRPINKNRTSDKNKRKTEKPEIIETKTRQGVKHTC